MIMAPVSVPCQSHTATTPAAAPAVADDANASADGHANKKRASIHYPDDSTAAKRMSLHYGHRSRSHSESRATPPTSSSTSTPIVVPETSQENKDEEEEGASSLSESVVSLPPPAASSSSSAAVAEGAQATGGGAAATKPSSSLLQTTCTPMEDESCSSPQGSKSNVQEMATDQQQQQQEPEQQPDLELMKQLSSFLRDQGNASAMDRDESAMESRMSMDKNASSKPSSSAGPTEDESAICDLVVTVRDFAYPKTHPYHKGQYPPEPEYEESDVEEDEEMEEDDTGAAEQDEEQEDHNGGRTQGQARGLYDFDAENSNELSFREGESLWIHSRQFPGWFLGEMDGKTGLVPENYVQLL